MENSSIYRDIAARTHGEVYIGVVGPVRTGKSTFIKQFMEQLVLPNIADPGVLGRATDELPQSAAGRTIMTTEPKFIPEEAVAVALGEGVQVRVRMIDCVGYLVPGALGHEEDDRPRMVVSPWFDKAVPFDVAAETGTRKVIAEHSTVGVLVTTDGSISDIPRADYVAAEERVAQELRALGKPFVIVLNCVEPHSEANETLAASLREKYDAPVLPLNCLALTQQEIIGILAVLTIEFPVREVDLALPLWVTALARGHWLRAAVCTAAADFAAGVERMRDIDAALPALSGCEYLAGVRRAATDLGSGRVTLALTLADGLFYRVLGEETGLALTDETSLLPCVKELVEVRAQYRKIESALRQVEATGYGIVLPTIDELKLEEPEIIKSGGKFGVRLRASAPSIHLLRADITTEVSPLVGSEKQSEDLVSYLLQEFEEDPVKIWDSNIFGKSLNELVNEGLQNKLCRMPAEARVKLQETLERIINEGCSGLVCLIL